VSRRLDWRRRALAELSDIARRDTRTAERIRNAVSLYSEHDAGDVLKLSGAGDTYRLRVGDWRILFALEEDGRLMAVLRVLNRRDAYR